MEVTTNSSRSHLSRKLCGIKFLRICFLNQVVQNGKLTFIILSLSCVYLALISGNLFQGIRNNQQLSKQRDGVCDQD